jgi:hypothetical protein
MPPNPALLLRFLLWSSSLLGVADRKRVLSCAALPTQRNFRAPEQRYQKWNARLEELVDDKIPPQGADRRPLLKPSSRLSPAASWIVILVLSLGLWVAVFEAVTL